MRLRARPRVPAPWSKSVWCDRDVACQRQLRVPQRRPKQEERPHSDEDLRGRPVHENHTRDERDAPYDPECEGTARRVNATTGPETRQRDDECNGDDREQNRIAPQEAHPCGGEPDASRPPVGDADRATMRAGQRMAPVFSSVVTAALPPHAHSLLQVSGPEPEVRALSRESRRPGSRLA